MPKAAPQTFLDISADSSLNKLYVDTLQDISSTSGNTAIFVTQNQEFITNVVSSVTNIINTPVGGNVTEVQFNQNSRPAGDSGFTYDAATDTITVAGNVVTGHLKTNNLLYANGVSWSFSAFSGAYADLTGKPTIPTLVSQLTNDSSFATETYVNTAVSNLVDSAPGALNTLNELAAALGDDASFASTMATLLSNKVDSSSLSDVATSGSYTDLSDTPSIPSTLSDLTNDSGFITVEDIPTANSISSGSSGSNSYVTTNPSNISIGFTDVNTQLKISNNGWIDIVGNINANGTHYFNGNIHATGPNAQAVYIGAFADMTTLTAPLLIMKNTYETYVQSALINSSQYGSADWVAYGDNGDDTGGWADLGMTSHSFNDVNYTITGKNDGYVFVQSKEGVDLGGNLVLATGGLGTTNDIVFGMGGFTSSDVFARMSHANNALEINGDISLTGSVSGAEGSTIFGFDGGSFSSDLTVGNISLVAEGDVIHSGNLSVTRYANIGSYISIDGYSSNISGVGKIEAFALDISGGGTTTQWLSVSSTSNLGDVGNITITGAEANGQVLTSDINGHLSWANRVSLPTVATITGGTINLDNSDLGKFVISESNDFIQLPTSGTVASGWYCTVAIMGSGANIVVPSGATLYESGTNGGNVYTAGYWSNPGSKTLYEFTHVSSNNWIVSMK